MGSATKHALRTLKGEVDRLTAASSESSEQLFDAIDTIVQQPQLRSALADAVADASAKRSVVERLFGGRLDASRVGLLASATGKRWSNEAEFALGLQELGVRAVSQGSGDHDTISRELQEFLEVVSANPDLELTLGSKLSDSAGKRQIVDRLFANRVGAPTLTILRHLIAVPSGRRIRRLITWAQSIVADQANRQVATVTVATSMDEAQLTRLRAGLTKHFGRQVAITQVIDPAVIGGLRVQLGDDVIDDTVQSKLGHLRRQFA